MMFVGGETTLTGNLVRTENFLEKGKLIGGGRARKQGGGGQN